MNADFFFKFSKFQFGTLVNAEDFSDKVNYQWTGAFLIIATAVIAMRQYIFTPIQCWVPPEWPRPWEEYTENYCWIQNTYHVAFLTPDHPDPVTRRKSELNYYQWVPFVLALEALLVYLPHLLWKIIVLHTGYNPNAMIKFAAEAATMDQDRRKKLVFFLSRHIEKAMNCRGCGNIRAASAAGDYSPPKATRMRRLCHRVLPCYWFGKRSGTMLTSMYFTNKLIYVAVAIGHLFMMKSFLGFESLSFGWDILYNLLRGREWEQTLVFPRVTFCDVPSKHVGQWNVRSVQCVLPVNLLNEKIYIFLWFWTLLCLALTLGSTLMWVIRLLVYKNRQGFVKKYLQLMRYDPEDDEERTTRKHFVSQFLSHDGVLILRMIAENIGDLCAADIIDEMYKRYRDGDSSDETPASGAPANNVKRQATSPNNLMRRVSVLNPQEELLGKKSIV